MINNEKYQNTKSFKKFLKLFLNLLNLQNILIKSTFLKKELILKV
jgi:hypothetical protein